MTVELGHHGPFRQAGGGDADVLETLCDEALRTRQDADEQVHAGNPLPVVVECPPMSVAEQTDHIVGEEFAVEHHGGVFDVRLLEKLLELLEKLGEVGAEALAPMANVIVGNCEEPHEDMWTSEPVPMRFTREPHRLMENVGRRLVE